MVETQPVQRDWDDSVLSVSPGNAEHVYSCFLLQLLTLTSGEMRSKGLPMLEDSSFLARNLCSLHIAVASVS